MKLVLENCSDAGELLQKIFDFSAQFLGIDKMEGTLYTRVVPPSFMASEDADAQVLSLISPKKEMLAFINEKIIGHPSELIEAFSHEMVHVKQMLKEELVADYETGNQSWKGKWYSLNYDYQHSPESDMQWPWEQEAYPLGNKIAKALRKKLGIKEPTASDRIEEVYRKHGARGLEKALSALLKEAA